MRSIKSLLFLALGISAAVMQPMSHNRRDSDVLRALQTVNSDVISFTNTVNNYNGGISGAIPVQNAAQQLNSDIKAATNTANNSPPSTEADCQSVADYTNYTLCPNVKKAVNAIIAKKDQFSSAGLKGTIKSSLQNILTSLQDLYNALVSKCPSSKQAVVNNAVQSCLSDLQRAINAYS